MKKLFSVFLCLTVWLSAFGDSFTVNGINYNTIGNGQVEVTSGVNYSGSVVIPSSVTYTDYYGETHTYSVTSIGSSAFMYCSSLTSVTIPNSVTSIGYSAFYGCSGLTSVTIPNSVTSIGYYAFSDCTGLTSVTIPNGVTSIGNHAFAYCSGLTSVTIPNSVTYIGSSAFDYCSSLPSVTIPSSVTSIGSSAFYYCTGLTSISVDAGNTHYDSRNNCNAIIETSTNKLIAGCMNTVIPNSVTSIDHAAFAGRSGLTSVTIPSSVTSIGSYAFCGCTGLTSVTIPNSVTSIGMKAFAYCSGLTSVTIPNSVTSIGDRAFGGCSGLTSVTIPNSVTSIGYYTFYDCTGLTSVTIPNSVTSIGDYAFYDCTGLTSVTIPNSVTYIGDYAFANCSNITDITCQATIPPTIKSNTFANYDATLYVPSGSVGIYSAKAYWKNFFIQPIPGVSHAITVTSNDSLMGTTLGSGTYEENTNAQLVAVTQAGYSFQQWSDGNTDNPRNVVVTSDSTFTAEFTVAGGVNDTIYLEYDGKDAMQYTLEDYGVYYLGGKVYNSQNLYIKLYYSDGKLLLSGTNDIEMSSYPNGIYIVTDGKGGFLKINHYR